MRALFSLLLTACGCSTSFAAWEPAILRDELPPGKGAITVCAENNVPYIVIDSASRGLDLDEGARVHELVHVKQILAYRGGCWPFLTRYRHDTAFKAQVELEAYCEWGRWMMSRNRQPQAVWDHISVVMLTQYGHAVRENCLFEEGK